MLIQPVAFLAAVLGRGPGVISHSQAEQGRKGCQLLEEGSSQRSLAWTAVLQGPPPCPCPIVRVTLSVDRLILGQ